MSEIVRQCTATTRSGARCKTVAIRGGSVCRMHGGSAPQVKAKAARRLAALIDPHLPLVAQRIVEGLSAENTEFAKFEGKITDHKNVVAYGERRLASELAMKALGIAIEKDSEPAEPMEVTINVIGAAQIKLDTPQ